MRGVRAKWVRKQAYRQTTKLTNEGLLPKAGLYTKTNPLNTSTQVHMGYRQVYQAIKRQWKERLVEPPIILLKKKIVTL